MFQIKPYILSFISIFVAVNALGVLPLFISLTEKLSKKERHKVIINSIVTATVIAIAFMLIGKLIFMIMGISVADFKIAGGILLLILSVNLLLPEGRERRKTTSDVGIFPLGTPLITGPAVLTTSLVMIDAYGLLPTLAAFIINMLVIWFIFSKSDIVIKVMGVGGTRAFSKVADILLTAIAVMMIRKGIIDIINDHLIK
ncbi:MAG: MarC family protein [Candidatus Omnitrophica bacterium]|nr:MarC family protein [Candidatus Omnitrophota bacterium]